jgi:transcriptional regulator with XRE-family HTH domain
LEKIYGTGANCCQFCGKFLPIRLTLEKYYGKIKPSSTEQTSAGGEDAMKDILAEITNGRKARGWTEYQLAEQAGLPQSTVSSWYRKKLTPSVTSLEKVCGAFGITMSQLFAEEAGTVTLTEGQRQLLERWNKLNDGQKEALLHLMEQM